MNSTLSYVTNLVKEKMTALKGEDKSKTKKQPEGNSPCFFRFFITFKTKLVDAFSGVNKATILHEAKCFNDSQINDKKCRLLLSRLVYLINQVLYFLKFFD